MQELYAVHARWGGKTILKLVLELKSHGHHSQAGITMHKIRPKPSMKRLIVARLWVPNGLFEC